MRKVKQFCQDAGGWGVASVVAAVVSFGILLWEHTARHAPVPEFWTWTLIVALLWLGAYKAWEAQGRAHEQVGTRLGKLLADGPQVWLDCDWTTPISNRFGIVMNRPFIIENRGQRDAFEIQIEPIKRSHGTASFELISSIPAKPANNRVKWVPNIEYEGGTAVLFRHDFELLIKKEFDSTFKTGTQKAFTIVIPITIQYSDVHGNQYVTLEDFEYDAWQCTGAAHLRKYECLSHRPTA